MINYLIVVAGGTGTRMQGLIPKQFLELSGKPVIVQTLRRFIEFDPGIRVVVVMHPEYVQYWNDLLGTMDFHIPHQVVAGGEERFHSVKEGIRALGEADGVVGIHDAVRPLVSLRTIRNAYEAAAQSGAAIPVVSMNESIREVSTSGSMAVNRVAFRMVQTPQCFRLDLLRYAYEQSYKPEFTDDASVVEAAGHAIQLVEGNRENIKLTTPTDLIVAQALLDSDLLS